MKYFISSFFALIFFAVPALAQIDVDIPIPGQTNLYEQLCDFRRLFCGDAAVVIIGTAVFIIGLLLFAGRLSWTFVLMMVAFSVIFVSADDFREYITGRIYETDANGNTPDGALPYKCDCKSFVEELLDG